MRLRTRLIFLAAAISIASAALGQSADIIFVNGDIYTVDASRSWVDAVAIRGNRIAFVGNNEDALALKDSDTRVVDLDGRMMLPGFQDAHVHPIEAGMAYLGCSLHDGTTAEDYARLVAECARRSPDIPFIDGGGWTMDKFVGGLPDKKMLDSVVADRPVILKSATGHQLWVNSRALELAGVDADTPDPEGGRVDRYPGTTEPSGSVQENSAMNLIFAARPDYTQEQMSAALRFGQHYLNQYGVTTVQDALTYMAFDERGELTLRVVGALVWNTELGLEQIDRIVEARARFNTRQFTAPAVKIWLDGVLEVHTAALLEPYLDREDGHKGELLIRPGLLNEVVARLDALGFQIHFHAIGDAAIRSSLDSLEHARKVNGVRDSRHHLSHIELFDPTDISRFRELDAVANFQPYWAWADHFIVDLTIPKLGPERSRWLYPIGSVLNSGAVVAFGSDWFVTSGNPMLGIETAITRRDPISNSSLSFNDSERIRLHDAIAAYTINGAYVNFLEDEAGSIEAGKLADLIVLDRNLFAIPSEEISDVQVLLTLLDGRPVYGDWSLKPQRKSAD